MLGCDKWQHTENVPIFGGTSENFQQTTLRCRLGKPFLTLFINLCSDNLSYRWWSLGCATADPLPVRPTFLSPVHNNFHVTHFRLYGGHACNLTLCTPLFVAGVTLCYATCWQPVSWICWFRVNSFNSTPPLRPATPLPTSPVPSTGTQTQTLFFYSNKIWG